MAVTLASDFGSYRRIFIASAPLVLSQSGLMLMHLTDRLLVSWYSTDAIAAIGPASMLFYALAAVFLGMAGYTTTFVAQYVGAGRFRRVGAAVWQGIYLALAGGILLALVSLASGPVFRHIGHAPAIVEMEITFFSIMCWGAPLFLLSATLAGFFSGRHDNVVIAAAQILGLIANALFAYVLIFGHWGMPRLGVTGAAMATVISQGVIVLVLAVVYFSRANREKFGTLADWPIDLSLLSRLLKYGLPAGSRFFLELIVWLLFLIFMGRVGEAELAATNIAQGLNGIAFFPTIGIGIAISAMVGQAQGANRSDLAERCVWRGLAVAEVWMLLCVAVFLAIPHTLVDVFHEHGDGAASFEEVLRAGVTILRFVALYCVFDAFNIILLGSLQGAGDTRWTLAASTVMHIGFLAGLVVLDHFHTGVMGMWGFVSAFVFTYATVWLFRFRSGKWKTMRVIEHMPAELETSQTKMQEEADHG